METKCEIDIGGKTIEFSTGKIAMQANSVLVKRWIGMAKWNGWARGSNMN